MLIMKNTDNSNMDGLREKPKDGMPIQDNHIESVLRRLYPDDYDWVHYNGKSLRDSDGKVVRTSIGGHQVKPDFVSERLKTIIEFDGAGGHNFSHYSSARQCIIDQEKDALYRSLGYKVIRIPMYVQLDSEMVEYYFGIKYEKDLYAACHCHGFAHSDVLLPADFCQLGIERFQKEFMDLPQSVKNTIVQSLKERIGKFVNEDHYPIEVATRMVLPTALESIIL